MYVALERPEILYATETLTPFMQSPTKLAMAKLKREVCCLLGFLEAEWVHSRHSVPKYLDVFSDICWASDEERKRSTTGVAEMFGGHPPRSVGDAITGRAVWRGGGVLRLQPRDRGWTGNVPLADRGVLRGEGATAVPAARSSAGQAQAGSDTWRSDTCGHRKGESLLECASTNENVVDLMTKHLALARVEELLSMFGVRRCTRGHLVACLFRRVETNHLDGRTYHVATVSLAHKVTLLVVCGPGARISRAGSCWGILLLALVLSRHRHSRVPEVCAEAPRRQRERHRCRVGVFSHERADGTNPARRASHLVAATRLVGKEVEGRDS